MRGGTPGSRDSVSTRPRLVGRRTHTCKAKPCPQVTILSGRVEQRRGDDWIEMGAGDTILIREGEIHQTRNIGTETADLMLAYSSGSRLYET